MRLGDMLSSEARAALVVFLGLLPIYLLTVRTNPYVMSPDPVGVSGSAWSLAHHGTPVLPRDTSAWHVWLIRTGGGAQEGLVSNREPGLVGLGAIAYLFAPGASIRDVTPPSVLAAVLTAAAMAVLSLVFARFVGRRTAVAAALLAGLGTSSWGVSSSALWPHSPDQLFLALALLSASAGSAVGGGLSYALAITVRPPLAVAAAVQGLWRSWTQRSVRPAAVVGGLSAVGLAVVLAYSAAFWRGGLDSGYVDAGSGFVSTFFDIGPAAWLSLVVNITMTLVEPSRGVLPGSAFLLLLLPGLPAAWRRAPAWVRSGAVGGAIYMLIQLKANRYSGGEQFWSYRYPLEAFTLASPLLLLAWREWTARSSVRRAYFSVLASLSITVQALGAFSYPALHMGAGRPNPWLPGDQPWVAVAVVAAGAIATLVVFIRTRSGVSVGAQPKAKVLVDGSDAR